MHSQDIKDPEISSPKNKVLPRITKAGSSILPDKRSPVNRRRLASFCPGNFVQCKYGMAPGGKTCEDACDTECCVGKRACDGFTGKICKDSVSCVGPYACADSDIGVVSKGCNGDHACFAAGPIGLVHQSCLGKYACQLTGSAGEIGEVLNSCAADASCPEAGGTIEKILDSCNALDACAFLAANNGRMGVIASSCNAASSCRGALSFGGDKLLSFGIKDCCSMDTGECEVFTSVQLIKTCAVPSKVSYLVSQFHSISHISRK